MITHPARFFGITSLLLALCPSALLIWFLPGISPLYAWLLAISLSAFCFCGYDKLAASRGNTRVPEATLLLLTLIGGTAGMMLAMAFFRHKTIKRSFRLKFWLIVALQVVAIAAWFYLDHDLGA